VGFIKEFL